MNWWMLASTLIASFAVFWAQRIAARADKDADKADTRMRAAEERLSRLEMKVAAEMPSREDFKEQSQRIESIAATLSEVRDMVIRMEAREGKN